MKQPSWYKPLEKKLLPMQSVVTLGIWLIIIISVWMLFQDPVKRTAWVVYMWMP